ncbi:Uncharacterised protein [Staphylococcus saprophyticus]|uniref:Uncharacterized protein n=1 Tax=Staphylococcus saprophyticus TaxID=29385 RepID=A0A380JLS6_STASA|nr:Uncharacterised protein [Staphylococcus saprophyticus]SUN43930.1 Uncharacterised protein [Staphylococcus saprophyticus]
MLSPFIIGFIPILVLVAIAKIGQIIKQKR